ncbi:hypothetical protein C0989_012437 [Termitomyces sp. Mn162]|nr:hypothetical protein C0989_012437 [Termitomyces sp. Mn162]
MVFKKSLWKQISQTKDKQLVLEARKSFFNEALPILSGKLSDAKAIEELKEKAEVYFKESQARKEAQEVNKGQAAEGVAENISLIRNPRKKVWKNKGKKKKKEKRQRKPKSAEYVKKPTTPVAQLSTIQLTDMQVASRKGRNKEWMDLLVASRKRKEQADLLMTSGKGKGKQQADPLISTKFVEAILS